MRKLLPLLAALLLVCPLALAAPSAEKKALIDELLSLTGAPTTEMQAVVDVYDRHLTAAQLRQLIAFFKSDAGKRFVAAQMELVGGAREQLEAAIGRSKAKRTMADLRTLAVCAEAYATDYNAYPEAKNLDELQPLIQPTYVRNMPKVDGWGNPFAYRTNQGKDAYRFVSGGPDGKIDPSSLKVGVPPSKANDDIIFENGEFVQSP